MWPNEIYFIRNLCWLYSDSIDFLNFHGATVARDVSFIQGVTCTILLVFDFRNSAIRFWKKTKAIRKNIVSGNWFRWLLFLGKKIKEPGAILLNAWLNWIPRNSHLVDLNRHYSWAIWTLIYWLGVRVMWASKFSRCFCHITYVFKMNLHSEIYMSRNSLLESSELSEN